MRGYLLAAVALVMMLAVGGAAALGASLAGALAASGGAILAALGGWHVVRITKRRLQSGAAPDSGDRARMVAVQVLYVIVAGAIVLASLRATRP